MVPQERHLDHHGFRLPLNEVIRAPLHLAPALPGGLGSQSVHLPETPWFRDCEYSYYPCTIAMDIEAVFICPETLAPFCPADWADKTINLSSYCPCRQDKGGPSREDEEEEGKHLL